MKKMKRLAALFLAVVMVMAMGMTAMAQTKEPTNAADKIVDGATITITNASKGETYNVYKLFDATVGDEEEEGGENKTPISYTGDIPEELGAYFKEDAVGNISAKDAAVSGNNIVSTDLQTALAEWTVGKTPIATAVSNGEELEFINLPWGYYVVTTSLGAQSLTVTSTRPDAEVIDKNITEPTVDPENGKSLTDVSGNTVSGKDVYTGQTVYYTLKFTASNFESVEKGGEKIASYIVHDDLPAKFLKDPSVVKIMIKNGEIENGVKKDVEYTDLDGNKITEFAKDDNDNTITLAWVDANGASRYLSGAEVVITYRATVADSAQIAGTGNKNTFKLGYKVVDKEEEKKPSQSESSETISTYALAIKKVDGNLEELGGAQFKVKGLKTRKEADGVYVVENAAAAAADETLMATDVNGILIIKGVKAGEYKVTEEVAPDGFNKLLEEVTVTATKTSETETNKTIYLDENGEVTDEVTTRVVTYTNEDLAASVWPIVNESGAVLPSTGGIGTTIFYVVGGIMVLGAGVLLITKKRMSAK